MGADNITTEENTQNVKTGIEQVKEVMGKTACIKRAKSRNKQLAIRK